MTTAANYLEISVSEARTHGEGRARYTDFKMEMKTNMPCFKVRKRNKQRKSGSHHTTTGCPGDEGDDGAAPLLGVQVAAGRGGQDRADQPAQVPGQIVLELMMIKTQFQPARKGPHKAAALSE